MIKNILALLVLAAFAATSFAETQENTDAVKPVISQFANKGTVLDVVESPMYTYLQVSCDAGTVWLAASKNVTRISKGDAISYPNGVVMRNFYSKSLNRSVDKIIFVNNVAQEK